MSPATNYCSVANHVAADPDAGKKHMKIQYRTRFSDVVGFIWIHYTRSRVQLAIIAGLSAFIAWDTCHEMVLKHGCVIGCMTLLIATTLLFSIFSAIGLSAAILTALSRRNKTFMTDNTLELLEERIVAENRYAKTDYKWDAVQKIIKTRRCIVLYVTHSTGIVVPRRAFETPAEWESFCGFVFSHSNN
jgi:hypothetical protein